MQKETHTFKRELGLIDATSIVAGSMIGSGIFIVSAWDRSSPSDSVILTIKNQCKAEWKSTGGSNGVGGILMLSGE